MFIKPAVVPRIQPALRSIRDSINISNIRDIRDNYFMRANNNRQQGSGPHPPPRSNRQQQQQRQAPTTSSQESNNNNYSSGDEESLGPGFSVCGVCRVCTCIKLGEEIKILSFFKELYVFIEF